MKNKLNEKDIIKKKTKYDKVWIFVDFLSINTNLTAYIYTHISKV